MPTGRFFPGRGSRDLKSFHLDVFWPCFAVLGHVCVVCKTERIPYI